MFFDCTCTFGSFNLVGYIFDIASKHFCTIIGIEIDCLHQNEDALQIRNLVIFIGPKFVVSLHNYRALSRLPTFLLFLIREEIAPRMVTVHRIGGRFAAHQSEAFGPSSF